MTIPQGDNRGPQSVSERRKVTFAGGSPSSGSLPSKQSTTTSALGEDNGNTATADTDKDIHTKDNQACLEHQADLPTIREERADKFEKDIRNQQLYDCDHLEVNVTVISPSEAKKSPLPLLNFLKGDEAESSSSDRTRKLSLNLPKSFQKQTTQANSAERIRRYSQPPKSSYHKIPQEDPSPPSPLPQIFTLQHLGRINPTHKPQSLSTHSAEVHAPFNDKDGHKGESGNTKSYSRETSNTKRVLFGKQTALTRTHSSSSKSLDDLSLVHHGGGARKTKSISTSRSVSSEDLTAVRKKRAAVPGGNGGHHPRRLPGDPHPSPGSPSRCCLVSVSRVPMAAATSHLTLDSDYQTVRLAVLGAPGVGKSSIVRQFVMQQFVEEYVPTEQRQIFCPAVIINEHLYEVRIIDCPYIPYFPVNSLYEWTDFRGYGLRNATAYVLVYDITSEESFEYIKSLRLQILESRNMHDVPIFVVGNKHDLAEERGVPRREVREIANLVKKQWKCGYIECSAKYNWHIMLLFKELMKTVDYIDYGHKPTSMRVQDALRRNRCLIL